MKQQYLHLIFVLSLILLPACGGAGSSPATQTGNQDQTVVSQNISAIDGGSITSSDGKMTLTIPAGALDEDTEISIAPVETDAGTVYDFQPDGLVFNEPAIATLEIDLAERDEILDENGDPVDELNVVPDVMLFLLNDDGTAEMLETSEVESDEDDSIIVVTTEIPHFTSMLSVTGSSFYVYIQSLGSHYVGIDFRTDVNVRYLGYSHTSSYKNMSIEYKVLSITVNKISFDISGNAIKIVSPNPITRSDHLSQRGQNSATRPKFNCSEAGESTVDVTVNVVSSVEVTFKPENKTRAFLVNHSETNSRKGKCIARVSQNDYGNTGDDEGYHVALADPTGDVLVDYNDTLVAALELDIDTPTTIDTELVSLELVGDQLNVSLQVADMVPMANPQDVQFLSFDLLVLDPSVGDTGFDPFADALWDLSLDAAEPGTALSASVYEWNGTSHEDNPNVALEATINDQTVELSVSLTELNMTADEALNASFRAVTQLQQTSAAGGDFFVDVTDLDFNNTL